MAETTSVAVLGTGTMGSGIARSLLRAGHEVIAWNRTLDAARPLEQDGAKLAETPAQAVAAARFVITMLADGDATEAVARQAFAGAPTGTVWLQMATVGVLATARLAELAREAEVGFVDAPVSGTKQPAEDGKLIVMAAGPPVLRDACAPVFDAIAQRTVWVGEVPGTGTRAKLVVNTWLLGLVGVMAETLALADALGLDPAIFFDVVRGGPLDLPYLEQKGAEMRAHEYPPSFSVRMAAKDARLIDEAAASTGRTLPVVHAVREELERAAELGHVDEDIAAVREVLTV